jgi:hypothetical protein
MVLIFFNKAAYLSLFISFIIANLSVFFETRLPDHLYWKFAHENKLYIS